MSNKPIGTWNYVPSENKKKDDWQSVSRPSTSEEVEQNNRAIENWYRASQSGNPNAGDALLGASLSQKDFDNWEKWRKQNAGKLDVEYTFKSLDQDVLTRVADKYKSQWGDKQYYDLFDPEDAYRLQTGAMPKYLTDKYDLNDPYDQYLLENNLPYRSMFNDMYSEAYKDYEEDQTNRYNRLSGFTNAWNSAVDSYDKFQSDFINNVNEARKTKGDALTEREMEDITIAMLTSGRYDDVASRFTQPTEEEDKDALTLYIEQLNTPDYSVYDNALAALQNGEDVDEAFYTSYKDADYQKWFAQKTAFTLQNLIDAYDLSITKAEMAKYAEYSKAVSNEDLPGAAKELGRIKTSVEDRMKESRFDKANQAYQMLLAENEVRSSDTRLKPFEGEAFYTELKNRLDSFRVSGKDSADFIDMVRELDALNAESVRLDEQINYNTKADNAKAMVDAAKKDTDFDKYASQPVPRKEESQILNTLKMYTVGNEYDYLFDPQGTAMSYMTRDERSVYAYYMNKYGSDKAQEYIDNITPVLYERSSAEDTEIVQNAYNMSPILASYAGTVLQPQTALEGYVTAAQSLFGGKLPEVNDPRFRTSRMAAEARQMVADTMTPTGQFFYQTGMSILDNLARLPLKHAGLGVMAGSVFAQGTDQALQSGATPEQAVAIGAAAAVIEVVTEKVSLENLFEPKLAGSARQIVRETLKQAGIEASEEMASEILNIIADVQIMGNDSEWEKLVQHYMHEEGLSRQQAEAKAFGDKAVGVMIAGAGGFLSGGIMGGGSVTLSNYMTGLRSGGNVANALSVGTKAIGQYQQDLQTYGKLASDTITDTIKDISSLPLDSETKKSMIGDASAIANQPANHIPQAVAASYRQSVDTIKAAANRARAIGADYTARKAKVTARLTRMLDTVASARTEAETALNRGDLNAHHAAVMKAQKAMEDYRAEYSVAEAETAALQAKQTEQESELANKVKEEAANLRTAVEQAATWQDKLMVIRDRLSDQEWNAMSLEEQEAMVDETITQLDSEFDQDKIAANMADAFMRGDQSDAEFWESMLYHDLTPESTNDAVNYKDNPKDAENPLKTSKDGDNFNVINEMVNGGENNEAVQAKGETNAETGRDRVSRAESDLAQDARRGEEQNAGRARRDGAQASGTNRSAWGAQQEQDVTNAVAEYNRTHTKQMPVGSIRKAGKISEAVQKVADYIKGITGRDSFFIESDTDLIGGFQTNDRRYVVYTGDPMTDLFNLAHENGHSNKDFLDVIYAALDSGEIPNSSFQAYVRQRTENIARKQGIPVSQVTESISQLREEFACDMFGLYMVERYFGTANWNQYGIPTNSRQVVRNAFNAVLPGSQRNTSQQNGRASERTADDELYDALLRSGSAISEQDAEGVNFSYTSMLNDVDAASGEFNFSENFDLDQSQRVFVDYTDKENLENIAKEKFDGLVNKGKVFQIDKSELEEFSRYFQIQRGLPREKLVELKNAGKAELKKDLRRYLKEHLVEAGAEVNFSTPDGMIIAKFYDNFVQHTVPKRGSSTSSMNAVLIKNSVLLADAAEYLYSTKHDIHSNDSAESSSSVEYWDYFLTPVSVGDVTTGVLFAVRKVKDEYAAGGHQVYRMNNKTALSKRTNSKNGFTSGATKAVLDSTVPNAGEESNTSAESSQFNFSENAPARQSRLNDAWQLYDDGSNPTEYYASNPNGFDLKTSNLLRGLMLRNGENVGGALSDANMERITDIFSRANKRHAIGLTVSSPVRVFEDVTGWGGSTAEERAQNVRDGNYLKNTYYEYGNVQAANRETWISEKMRPVIEAIKNNGDYGALESSITQMLGEGIITEDQAKNAVTDGKTMIVEVQDGVFVLDGKSRLLYSSDSKTSTEYTEEYRERVKRAIKAGKGNRVNAFMPKPKTTENPLRVTRNGNTVTVKDANGKVVAEVTNGTNPNMKAVNDAVDALRTFYADAYKEISNVRLENGYAPPGYIENYFPHQSRTYDGIEGFIEALTANDLPTAINGMTGTFSPGQPWNSNLQTRLGTYTEFDAIRGFNRYVNGAGDTIFYTPVIQRLRQLEKAIRTQGANALTEEDAKRNSAFVDWLHEYANEWANKKSSFDRGAESIFGREAYSVSQMLTKMVSASAVGGNVSSAMSNIISGLTGYAQIDAKYTVPEIVRTVGQLFQLIDKKGQYDGFADKIPFLKRRFSDNEDILIQNMDKLKRKGSKALYAMFSAIDRFAVESVARAKYSECVANGMTDVQAIAATNDMLIKNFSDRGKGQAARVFNVKWLRPVAQFQLEVLNQMNHFRDMDRAEVEAKLADLEREYAGGIPFDELEVKALSSGGYRKLKKELAYLVLLSLWGIITRGLLGRDQTWNPYGMVKDAVEDIQEGGIKQAGEGIMEAVIDNAPFLSVLSGGGRVPIAGNLSYVTNVLEAVLNGESEKLTNADWIKGGTAFIPGGGQLRKTLTGIDANAQGGSYTDDGKLRYPISEDDFWRSAVFGPSAVAPDDYEWGTALSKKDTAVYQELVEDGFDQSDLYDTLLNYGGSTNAERALSLLANRNDFSDDELDVIAEAVGLNYKGSLEQYAEKEANKYLKKKQKELETGDISQESYDEIENVFDEYFRLLGMDN